MSEKDYSLEGKRVRSTVEMGWVILTALGTSNFDPPGRLGTIKPPYDPREEYMIVEFDDGSWAEYSAEEFEFVEQPANEEAE